MKKLFLITALLFSINTFSQQNAAFWSNSGNNVATNDFLGSVNNTALVFKANNQTWMRILPTGVIQINSIANLGTGLVTFDNDGNIVPLPYINDNTKVLYSDGTWGTINFSNSGWTNGYDIVYNGTGNVGIGTFTPQYKLDVWGNLRVTGTVFASGVVITDEVKADTGRIGVIADDVTLIGNVGIGGGVLPNIKLNVVGDIQTSGKILVSRFLPLVGDSAIHFGDSSISLYPNYNQISWSFQTFNNVTRRGLLISSGAVGSSLMLGSRSVGIGINIGTDVTAQNSIVIGNGASSTLQLINKAPNSLIVGFGSILPTLFVGPSSAYNTTGKVGIGTDSPIEKFQVNNGNILIRGTNNWLSTSDNAFVYLGDQNNYVKATFSAGLTFGVWDGNVSSVEALYIAPGGNVGIGTLNPTYKLSVNGNIRAKSIKVETGWSDFVFYSDYYLMSLDSVEKFIETFGHLPNVPSAADVEKNGLDLGSSNAILLMKTEELYLYTFKLNKKIDVVIEDNKTLKQQNKLLAEQNELQKKEIELLKLQLKQQ